MFVGESPDWAEGKSSATFDSQTDDKESLTQLLQRQQQYIQSIKEVVDFLDK
jgi:hypothetical protein